MKCLVLFPFLVVSIDAFMVPNKASFRTRSLMKAPLAEESLEPLLSVAILDDDTPGVSQVEVLNVDFDKSKVPSVAVIVDEPEKAFVIADAVQEEIFVIDEREAAILSLQEEIQLKEDQYQELMVQLKEDMKAQEKTFQIRISDFITQLQAVKVNANEERMALVQTHVAKEGALRADMDVLLSERLDLEQQLVDLRERYTTDCVEWEDRFEAEQDKRVKEERALSQAMETLQRSYKDELKEIMHEKQQIISQIQRDMNNRLIEKESMLNNMAGELKVTKVELVAISEHAQQLEQERSSLRKMIKQSWKVVKSRVTNRWRNFRGDGKDIK